MDARLGKAVDLEAAVARIQIEDGDPSSQCPVILSALDLKSSTPVLQFSFTRSLKDDDDGSSAGFIFPYISLLLQAAQLTVTDELLLRIQSFFGDNDSLLAPYTVDMRARAQISADSHTTSAGNLKWDADGSISQFSTSISELQDVKPVYCEMLEVHPVHIVVSFTTSAALVESFQQNPLPFRLPSDVEDANLRLDALVRLNFFSDCTAGLSDACGTAGLL